MQVSIHQPDFIPWLGFFDKIRLSDLFIIGDNVQFRKKGWTNRNQIKTANGVSWLTIPVHQELGQPINVVKIRKDSQNNMEWYETHLRTLQVNYGKSKFFDEYIGHIEKIYHKKHEFLADFNLELLDMILKILDINVPILKLSEMNLKGEKTELIVNICKKIGADSYLSGKGGANYMDENLIKSNNIKLVYHKFNHPEYEQRFMKLGFIPNMSIIDLLFNEGPNSLNIIKSGSSNH